MTIPEQPVPLSRIYRSFAWVGAVLFGGGYAMLPLLEREVVERRRWCTLAEMSELYALAQVIPGIIAVNTALLVGHRYRGATGAAVAALGIISAPVLVILAVASAFAWVSEWPLLARLFAGLRPAVAGLLLATALRMIGRGERWERGVAAGASLLLLTRASSPLGMILGTIAAGLLWHAWTVAQARKGTAR
ncbi:MAG: chromate transporter [Lentisphaerae bacterium]|nr:chromate transporter [Lentisphaerota bacterium]